MFYIFSGNYRPNGMDSGDRSKMEDITERVAEISMKPHAQVKDIETWSINDVNVDIEVCCVLSISAQVRYGIVWGFNGRVIRAE